MSTLDQTLLAVVNYYYMAGLDQSAISQRLGISRTGVSRLIAQAREKGYVSIQPRIPGTVRHGLAGFLAEHFGLRDVLIAPVGTQDPEVIREHLGIIAACYLQTLLRDDLAIGISWGTSYIIDALSPTRIRNGRVIQLAGGLNPAPMFGPPLNEMVQALAAKLGASPYYLFSPAISDSHATAGTMRGESSIAEVLSMGASVELALFGVGDLGPGNTIPIASSLSKGEWAQVEEAGAVGAICVRFFDDRGRIVAPEIDSRTIGLTLDQLRGIPTKVGVAGGLRKQNAVLGALNGRLLDVLITDEALAEALFTGCKAALPAEGALCRPKDDTDVRLALQQPEPGS